MRVGGRLGDRGRPGVRGSGRRIRATSCARLSLTSPIYLPYISLISPSYHLVRSALEPAVEGLHLLLEGVRARVKGRAWLGLA